jgi:phage FluMu protein Com
MKKCPRCGSDSRTIIHWDGANCGGTKIKCAKCNLTIEEDSVYAVREMSRV